MVGRVGAPHGVRGEVRVTILSEDPTRFDRLTQVYLAPAIEAPPRAWELVSWRPHKGQALLCLAGVTDRNAAEALRDQWLLVPRAQALPLAPDEFYICELVGLEVETTAGEHLGRVMDVLSPGAHEVLVIHGPRGETMVPFVAEWVPVVDLEAGRLVIELLEGLL